MLIFDELKKNDPQLRLLALGVAGGLSVLLAGLWWVQIVTAREYESHLETQSYRTVRVPAARGKILDRNGRVLAENRPRYNISLYLDELRKAFDTACSQALAHARAQRAQFIAEQEKKLGRSLTKAERKQFALTSSEKERVRQEARFLVASNVVAQISQRLQQPLIFNAADFNRHYATRLALPYPVSRNLDPAQIARFEEQFTGALGADLELQSVRFYPLGTTAAHVLGYLQRNDSSAEGEDAFFSYRLPDYRGVVGIEGGFDAQLRGHAGAMSVLVNNLGYRQTANVWSSAEPGHNVVLTIDLDIQQAAERSLARRTGPDARTAVVVMDVRTGDLLAMVSTPAINPNYFVDGFPPGEFTRLNDLKLRPQINRATQENYAPGSIFKTVVGLACLEAGLDPAATIHNPGYIYIGRREIHDLAPPGDYDFQHAIIHSCNTYFITVGLQAGIDNIVRMGEKFHFGERTGLPTLQETPGIIPGLDRVHSGWLAGDTANLCIGQGDIAVTPLQMAVTTAAIANGGRVLWPRLVDHIEPQDPATDEKPIVFPTAMVRGELGVQAHHLQILHDAMLADVEDSEGTGRAAAVAGLHICAKTGTAQIMDEHNRLVGHTVWFISFAPYENPHYAVVVMVEGGASGGITCAPIARDIYETILKQENAARVKTLAQAN
jgi:penicillin-binding protein 2